MKHLIKAVDAGSVCNELGITQGCSLLSINGNEIADIIDYEHMTCAEYLTVSFELTDGALLDAEIEKDMYEPLGLTFENSLLSEIKQCKNKCVFCFIDQMPRGKNDRATLHFKDDDWRYSLIMGNYVTLTNVDDTEFSRILARKASPLYVSVHSTDGELRAKIMRNPTANRIMERLRALKDAGLCFHAQIVLCPGLNDGEHLIKTLNDLEELYGSCLSVAVIPVGLTKHRKGLYPLRRLTAEEARDTLFDLQDFQARCRRKHGTNFVFAADEMYITAKLSLPSYESYEDFPQLENGVGLLRKFEYEFLSALADYSPFKVKTSVLGVTGVAAYSFLQPLFERLSAYNIDVELLPVTNTFFGESVTVAGLVCASDIIRTLGMRAEDKLLLLPRSMLRENDEVFLDGMTLTQLEATLKCKALPLCPSDGEEFLSELFCALRKAAMKGNIE